MKPENAEWLKQVLTFQAGLEDQAGPSRRPVAADSEDSRQSSEYFDESD